MTERQIETLSEGEFAGWSREVNREGFNGLVGAYYYQADDPANLKVAFKAGKDHLNGGGTVHGGCLLTLADTSMFIFSLPHLQDGGAVTVQLDAQFLSPGREGDVIVATGEVTRAGRNLVYVRGQLNCGERLIMTYSGVMARIPTRPSGDG